MLVNCRSPGFGLILVAETVDGFSLGAEMSSTPQGQGEPMLPEDLGRNCAKLLLEEVYRVGKDPLAYAHLTLRFFEVRRPREDPGFLPFFK